MGIRPQYLYSLRDQIKAGKDGEVSASKLGKRAKAEAKVMTFEVPDRVIAKSDFTMSAVIIKGTPAQVAEMLRQAWA
jgi:hypothetical protein